MTTNDQLILSELLEQRRSEEASSIKIEEFFELFTAEQILKDYDLGWDEIKDGIVGGGSDGGIDSIFLFVNKTLMQEDTELSIFKGTVSIDFHIIQAKHSRGFSEDGVQKFRASAEDLLDLTKDLAKLKTVYNRRVIDAFQLFQNIHKTLASRLPEFRFHFHYATLAAEVHENVRRQVAQLEGTVKRLFSSAIFEFHFSGAPELLEMARRKRSTVFHLPLAESPIASRKSYVALVRLVEFAEFLKVSPGVLMKSLFEANVRDYQGEVQVNKEIRNTLEKDKGEDFWWLNNGITVVASKALLSGKTLTLENPQIVNGHQTSVEVFDHFSKLNGDDKRCVLIRVIEPDSEESHQRIIRATNSQTTIPIAFLRATDEIHRNIEDYFKARNFYYDRRKNYYKNEGKPRERIVGVPFLAQAVMAILLGRPDDARARPSTLLKKDDDYNTVFNPDYPLTVYLRSVEVLKKTEEFLRVHSDGLSSKDVNNLKYHLAYFVVRRVLKKSAITPQDLDRLDAIKIDKVNLGKVYQEVSATFKRLGGDDQVAKGKSFIDELARMVEKKGVKKGTRGC